MLSAGLEMISSKPDALVENGKLVEGHVMLGQDLKEIGLTG